MVYTNYFKDMFESIQDYKKIIILFFIIKQDNELLIECGLSNNEIKSLYEECKKILNEEIENYFSHIKNGEESIVEIMNNI